MSYMVLVTFDLHNADSDDYQCVDDGLKKIGLKKTLRGKDGTETDLPYNTYAGEYDGADAATVASDIRTRALAVLKACNVHGRLFVLAGGDWAWQASGF